MTVKTFWFLNSASGVFRSLQEGGTQPVAATTGTGWTLGKTASGNYSDMFSNVKRAASTFGSTVQPSATALDTVNGDAWRSQNPMTGWFAKTSGQFGGAIGLRATTVSGQNVNLKMALWKGPANGVGATRITDAGQYIGFSGGASFTTTAEDVIFQFTEFFSPPKSIVMNNEYLFFQVGVQISIASGSNNADALFRVGSNASGGVLYFFSTPDFFERSPPFAVYGQSINRGSSF